MTAPSPARRVNPWIALFAGAALAALAVNGERIYAAASGLLAPAPVTPAPITIVAPIGSDTV
jgi:hypothetical protein